MGVFAQMDDVFALFQHIAAGRDVVARVVIVGKVFRGDGEGELFALARLDGDLVEADEALGRFFDLAAVRIVRRFQIQLHDLFDHAGGIIDDPAADDQVAAGEAHFVQLLADLVVFIMQAVAEGIDDLFVVVEAGVVARRRFGRRRFVIAVIDVDALFVLVIGARLGVGEGAVGDVGPGGIFGLIGDPGIDQAAGGVDVADQHFGHGLEALGARVAHPEDGVDVVVVFQLGDLDDVGEVADDDDGIAVGLGECQHLALGLRQLHGVVRLAVVVGLGPLVVALEAQPADEDDADGALAGGLGAVIDGGVVLEDGVRAARARRLRAGRSVEARFARIEGEGRRRLHLRLDLGIDGKVCVQRLFGGDDVVEVHAHVRRARAAPAGGDIADAERRHLAVAGQREQTVVFEEGHALFRHFQRRFCRPVARLLFDLRGRIRVFKRARVGVGEERLVVLGSLFGDVPRIHHMPLPAAEGEVERRRIGVRGHRQHDHQHHDDGDDRQDDDAELFVAHFHCLHSLWLYLRPAEGTAAAPGRLAPAPLRIRCPKYNPKRRKLQGVQHKLEICNVNFKKPPPKERKGDFCACCGGAAMAVLVCVLRQGGKKNGGGLSFPLPAAAER